MRMLQIAVPAALIALAALVGCKTDGGLGARIGVKLAVVEYIGEDQERAERVLTAIEAVRFFINDRGHDVALEELNTLLTHLVQDSTKLTPAEKIILTEAVAAVMLDLDALAPEGLITDETRARALSYLASAEQAARLVAPAAE